MRCTAIDCTDDAKMRGWCQKHYTRWRRHGDPEVVGPFRVPPHGPRRGLAQRWSEKVHVSPGCWEWKGARNEKGYGLIWTGSKLGKAHRVSWELHFGPIPDGLSVLHHCDNPPCVRPDHLWIGTSADNAQDRQAKGRQNRAPGDLRKNPPRGEKARHKLTEAQVLEIRRRAGTTTNAALSREYGVPAMQIGMIISRRSWAWLNDGGS